MKSLFLSIIYCLLLTTKLCQGSQVDSKKEAWSYSYPLMTALGLRNKAVAQTTKPITKSDSSEWTNIEKNGNESIIIIERDNQTESLESQYTLKKVLSSQNLGSEKFPTITTHSPLQENCKSNDKLVPADQENSIVLSGVTDKQPVQINSMQIDGETAAKKQNQKEMSISTSVFKIFHTSCCNCFETGAELKKKNNS